jgi:TRAP-type C4-dicarboxylate transport system permease small subunit
MQEACVKRFENVLRSITEKVAYAAMVALVGCTGLVVAHVIRRAVGRGLITGTNELVTLLAGCILSLGIPYLTFVKGHVAVGILVDRLAPRKQAGFDVAVYAISLGITVFATWAMVKLGLRIREWGWNSGVLQIPLFYFNYMMAGSLALTCVVLAKDLAKAVITIVKKGKVT